MESDQLIASLLIAGRTIVEAFVLATFPDFACMAITDQPPPGRKASITIDLFRLEIESIGLAVKSGRFGPCLIIVILCCDKGRALGTYQAATGNHF